MRLSCAAGVLLAILLSPMAATCAGPSDDLAALLDEVWESRLRQWPQFATRSGDRRYNDRLGVVSLEEEDRRAAREAGFLQRLRAIPVEGLSRSERIEHELLERDLADSLAEHRFKTHLTPITGRSGFHISFPELPDWTPLSTTEDYENYLARLRAFPEYAAGHVELMREGVRLGVVAPAVILEGWEESVDSHLVDDPRQSLLYKPFREFPSAVPESEHERLRGEAARAIRDAVLPAYRDFRRFMAEEYVPNCRATIGASALPEGRDFYRHRVRLFTTLDTTPEEVHQLGLSEVKRIRAEMDAIIRKVGFEGDFAAFVESLREDPRHYAKTEEELLARCAAILKRADGRLPALFGTLPRMPYGLKPVPDYIAPKTTSAYYEPPNGDGSKAGFFFLNTYNLPGRPMYMLEALAMHESVPGHHLQIALQQELEGLSPLRKFGGFTAFIEGWALYAERLGLEMGFYEDPYSDFGRLTMEVWRAGRLVVDTGIHYFGWTRDEAIAYLEANSAMSRHNIRAEVDRYIGWPGQALAYKSGELKIRQLRARAEERLGTDFDLRAFHDAVLENGAVPLDVLERLVDRWVDERVAQPNPSADATAEPSVTRQ